MPIDPVKVLQGLRSVDQSIPAHRLARVTSLDPLLVRFEGEARVEPTPRRSIAPEQLRLNDRVLMGHVSGKWVVMGRLQTGPPRVLHFIESGNEHKVQTTARLRDYSSLRLSIQGRLSINGESLFMRVNNNQNSGHYEWTRITIRSNGAIEADRFDGTGFHIAKWGTATRNNVVIDLINTHTERWSWSARGARLNPSTVSSISVSGGKTNSPGFLNVVQFSGTGGAVLRDFDWQLYGIGA